MGTILVNFLIFVYKNDKKKDKKEVIESVQLQSLKRKTIATTDNIRQLI